MKSDIVIYYYESDKIQEIITMEIEILSFAFIEKNGKKPSKLLIKTWIKRLQMAYHNKVITKNGDI